MRSTALSQEQELRAMAGHIQAAESQKAYLYDILKSQEVSGADPDQLAETKRRYAATLDDIRKSRDRIDALTSKLRESDSDRGDRVDLDTVALKPGQQLSEWALVHGAAGVTGSDLSVGRYFKGLVTGHWEGADLERMALSEGTLADGGFLVPTPLSSVIIDRARNQARVVQAGATTIPMESHTLAIARVAQEDGDSTANWKLEGEPITESALTFERVTLTAKSLTALVKASVELFQDAQNLENVLLDNFGKVLGLAIDEACLYGSGTDPEPQGVLNTAGVQTLDLAGDPLVIPTTYLDAVEKLWDANEEPTGIIQAPKTELQIARAHDTLGQPLRLPNVLDTIPRYRTKQVESDNIFLADWSQLLIGVRLGLQINVLRERYMDSGEVGFLAYLRADVQLARPAAFVVVENIDTAS